MKKKETHICLSGRRRRRGEGEGKAIWDNRTFLGWLRRFDLTNVGSSNSFKPPCTKYACITVLDVVEKGNTHLSLSGWRRRKGGKERRYGTKDEKKDLFWLGGRGLKRFDRTNVCSSNFFKPEQTSAAATPSNQNRPRRSTSFKPP